MPRPKPTRYTAEQEAAVRMMARGYCYREIIREIWHMEEDDNPSKFHVKECELTRLKRYPCFDEVWRSEVDDAMSRILVAKGLRRILSQIDDSEKWLANKAANDAVNFGKARLYAESDNKVVIEFANDTGMPEIGTPDTDEPDGGEE